MLSIARRAGFWLMPQMLALAALLYATGGLTLRREIDSQSYLQASRQSPGEMLRGQRTVGYPLVLRAVSAVSPEYRLLPWVQLAAHCLGCAAFLLALRCYGATEGQALAAGSGLLWGVIRVHENGVAYLLSDPLGRSLAVLSMAALLWVVAAPRRRWPWLGLALAVAATYHIRPVYLFLVPLVPCLGILLWRLRQAHGAVKISWRGLAAGLAAAVVLPLLAYCGLRWAVVGHFGLVSFGGHNIVGIAAELIDDGTIERLPEARRPLARAIHAERKRLGLVLESPNYALWRDHYNVNIHQVAVPQAERLYANDPVAVNRELTALSLAVLRQHPRVYLEYVRFSVLQGLKELTEGRVFMGLLGVATLLYLIRLLVAPRWTPAPSATRVRDALFWMALSFAAAKLLLVALVEVPLLRYALAAGTFLPAFAAVLALDEWRRLRAAVLGGNGFRQ